jgi:hypothetical protein
MNKPAMQQQNQNRHERKSKTNNVVLDTTSRLIEAAEVKTMPTPILKII